MDRTAAHGMTQLKKTPALALIITVIKGTILRLNAVSVAEIPIRNSAVRNAPSQNTPDQQQHTAEDRTDATAV